MRTTAGNHDRIGTEILVPLDQIPTNRWRLHQTSCDRLIDLLRYTSAKILQELRPCIFAGAKKNAVCVCGRLRGQCRHMQTAHTDIRTSQSVMIGNFVRSTGIGCVRFDDNESGGVVKIERFDVFILNVYFIGFIQITRQ